MIEADLSGITNFIAAVDGIIDAVETPGYKGDFLNDLTSDIDTAFMTDSIANRNNLSHVFEWPDKQGGEIPPIPLFKIVKIHEGASMAVSFDFLPSSKNVPLPDPSRYGFKPSKLQYLRRHKFKMKALVMETQSQVTIKPKEGNKHGLFIPSADSPQGYFMSKNPVTINPGGEQATGKFTEWWTSWFDSRAQEIATEKTKAAEETFAKNGRKAIRDATTGRFTRGKKVSLSIDSAVRRRAQLEFTMLEERSRQ